MSGYAESLKAAGAEVVAFHMAGDYQGQWVAVVKHDGGPKVIFGYYGSCSGCDAFQSEFDFAGHTIADHDGKDTWHDPEDPERFVAGCEQCEDWRRRLAVFGAEYLRAAREPGMALEDAFKEAAASWASSDERELYGKLADELVAFGYTAKPLPEHGDD